MSQLNVLLVEDSQTIQLTVKGALADSCKLHVAESLAKATELLQANSFDLFILDVGLPDGDGFDFCASLRRQKEYASTPIIFLTGLDAVDKKVHGFTLGADDYIVKPFDIAEFKARIESKLRKRPSQEKPFTYPAGFSVEEASQKVFLEAEGTKEKTLLNLTPIEYKLLIHLIKHEKQIFSRNDILTLIWGKGVHVSAHTIDTHLSSLRKKLGHKSACLKVLHKKGYYFTSSGVPLDQPARLRLVGS